MSPLDRHANEKYAYHRRLGRIRLHFDDLDDLLKFMQLKCKRVELWVGDSIADTGVEDLLSARRKDKYFVSIRGEEPQVEVTLYLGRTQIATTERRSSTKQLVDDVWLFCQGVRVPFVISPLLLFVVSLSVSFYAVYGWFLIAHPDDYEAARLIFYFGAVGFVNLTLIGRQFTHGSAYVVRKWRKDKLVLWRGIRKDTAMLIVGGILGGVIAASISALVALLKLPK
ncbi:UNVERIFIED_ORG: hypothetical protein FHR35_005507 [Microbispora rosea subsp. rosea]